LCSDCVEAHLTEADFEDKTDERYKRKVKMRAQRVRAAEKATRAAANDATTAPAPTDNDVDPSEDEPEFSGDDDESESSDDSDTDSKDHKEHPYCKECYNYGEVTDEELIAFLIKASPYRFCRAEAEDACLEHLLNMELDREEQLRLQQSTAAGMAAMDKAASEIVAALSGSTAAAATAAATAAPTAEHSPTTQQQQAEDRNAARLGVDKKASEAAMESSSNQVIASTSGKRKHE
jgi:hypothetical protein